MSKFTRLVLASAIALVVGFGLRAYDQSTGAEWVVSPEQIASAQASGKQGVETTPGSVAVLPIRSETADVLPVKWILAGLFMGVVAFRASGRLAATRPS